MKSSLNKKGQIQQLAPAIIALVIAATFLVLGLVMTQELGDSISADQSGSVVNESLTAWTVAPSTNQTLNAVTRCGAESFVVSAVWNETGTILAAGNYTAYTDGNIINATNDVWSNSVNNWKVIYTYSWKGEACEVANTTTAGLGTFADFWTIIVLAIVISIVIGLLLAVFGGAGRRR